ncbi:MAG: PAS domain S-box protein [Tildeniella nuda ZEHNDER 1965/U140]|jgi:PAS domain S-box-containing protein|nr:PAS domain S-box protein [Tildeniella nuda ZEHNDER 1965/U140]
MAKTVVKGLSEKVVAGGFALALLVLGGVATGSYLSVQKLIASRQSVEHTFEVLDALDKIFNGSTTVSSGRYGYIVNRDKTYLNDYKAGLQATEQAIQDTRRLTSDNPDQRERLAKVEQVIAARTAVAQRSIALMQQGQSSDARQDAFSDQGFRLGRKLRLLLTVMKDEERRLLQQRKAATDDSVQQAILVNGVGYLLGFSLLTGVFLMLHGQIRIRQRTEAALQKHSEAVSDLYNHAPCGYHSLDAAGNFTHINDTELDWLGYTRDELVHKNFAEVATAQSAAVFQENFPKFKEQGWISDVEFDLVRKDGTLLPVSLSATAIQDAEGNFLMSRSTLFDISDRRRAQTALQQANEQLEARVQERTVALSQVNALLHSELLDRKQAEQALLESEKQLRTITNALPVLISYVDADRRYRFNNRAYEHWFGYDWTTLCGQHLREVIGESAYQAITPYVEAALSGQEVLYENSVPYKDGGIRWIRAVYIPDFGEQGTVKGYFALINDITDRKLAEQALAESEKQLRLITDALPVLVSYVDADQRYRFNNQTYEHWYGQTRTELTGKTIRQVIGESAYKRIQPHVEAALSGQAVTYESIMPYTDGGTRWINATYISDFGEQGNVRGFFALIADITDRKLGEEALRESEQRLSLAVEGSGMATWDINLQTGNALWSAQHFKLLGYEPAPSGEATLSMWQRCVHPDDIESVMQIAKQAMQTRSLYRSEHRIRRADNGQIVWLAAFGRVLYDEAGQAVRFLGIILDISDRKRAELALQQAKDGLEIQVQERTAALKQSNDDLRRSNQELEQFAYVASHDLQEPLRAIMGYTQLLTQDYRDRLDETAQGYGGYIVEGAQRMQQLIQDLLHYSRAGTRDLEFAPTDCNAVLEQVLRVLQVAIAERNASITYDPLPTVIADQSQLAQLFQNLIGNAIKFCHDETPSVHISARQAEGKGAEGKGQRSAVSGQRSAVSSQNQFNTPPLPSSASPHPPSSSPLTPHPAWLFSVRDNGIGIKPRYLERIFEIFKRLHTRTEFPGTGIGLAICKKIVDRHDGHIWAESEPGKGTTFYFTIPYDDRSEP